MAIGTRLRPTIPGIEINHFIWNNFYHIHWMFVSIYFVHNLCYVLLGTLGVHLCSLPCVLKVTTPPLTRTDKIFEFNKEHWLRTISIYKKSYFEVYLRSDNWMFSTTFGKPYHMAHMLCNISFESSDRWFLSVRFLCQLGTIDAKLSLDAKLDARYMEFSWT